MHSMTCFCALLPAVLGKPVQPGPGCCPGARGCPVCSPRRDAGDLGADFGGRSRARGSAFRCHCRPRGARVRRRAALDAGCRDSCHCSPCDDAAGERLRTGAEPFRVASTCYRSRCVTLVRQNPEASNLSCQGCSIEGALGTVTVHNASLLTTQAPTETAGRNSCSVNSIVIPRLCKVCSFPSARMHCGCRSVWRSGAVLTFSQPESRAGVPAALSPPPPPPPATAVSVPAPLTQPPPPSVASQFIQQVCLCSPLALVKLAHLPLRTLAYVDVPLSLRRCSRCRPAERPHLSARHPHRRWCATASQYAVGLRQLANVITLRLNGRWPDFEALPILALLDFAKPAVEPGCQRASGGLGGPVTAPRSRVAVSAAGLNVQQPSVSPGCRVRALRVHLAVVYKSCVCARHPVSCFYQACRMNIGFACSKPQEDGQLPRLKKPGQVLAKGPMSWHERRRSY